MTLTAAAAELPCAQRDVCFRTILSLQRTLPSRRRSHFQWLVRFSHGNVHASYRPGWSIC